MSEPMSDERLAVSAWRTGEGSAEMGLKFAAALAERFTRPVPRMVKGHPTDEIADPLPADRVWRAMATHWIDEDGHPSFGPVSCMEAAEVCMTVRDAEMERLRAELRGALKAGDELRAENAELRAENARLRSGIAEAIKDVDALALWHQPLQQLIAHHKRSEQSERTRISDSKESAQ